MADHYDLAECLDTFLARPKIQVVRQDHLYPSEASVKAVNQYGEGVTHGRCLRSSYFRLATDYKPLPHNYRALKIFERGNTVEDWFRRKAKEMGIWIGNSIKFYDKEYNISGELDLVLSEPDGTMYIGEVKSFYGYNAEREIYGNTKVSPYPKIPHLLQTLVYLKIFYQQFKYARIIYINSGDFKVTTFKVGLHIEGDLVYPKVEGVVNKSFTVNGIFNRYKQLAQAVETKTMPPNDYELQYSDARIKELFARGEIAKTPYEKYIKKKLKNNEYLGDWECSYCEWKEHCWGVKSSFTL